MMGEIDLYGIYLPNLLLLAILAVPLAWVARRVLSAFGGYRYVWHPALFDLAIFVLILYGLTLLSPVFLH